MTKESIQADLGPLPELDFGARDHVEALIVRISDHFTNSSAGAEAGCDGGVLAGPSQENQPRFENSLVVGLFGEWGSGKSLWLKHIERYFYERLSDQLRNPSATESEPNVYTIPVFFNTWRYEKEKHLIVPLLKTLEARLREIDKAVVESKGVGKKSGPSVLARAANYVGIAAVALLSGLSTELSLPLVGKVAVNPKEVVNTTVELLEKTADERRPRLLKRKSKDQSLQKIISEFQSIYYDFQAYLQRLTRPPEADKPRFNLLFLIDDLDRCLPEKAVEMLEAIKLFLDVEGTAFVLALDDAVVERGIAHRYRDYNYFKHPTPYDGIAYAIDSDRFDQYLSTYGRGDGEPVSGHEYLEKIVQLPVRIPRPREERLEVFLLTHFADVFTRPSSVREEGQFETPKAEASESSPKRTRKQAAERESIEPLLRLFSRALPAVPRKYIRAAELLRHYLDVAKRRGWDLKNSNKELLTLARLTLIQLFAPRVYRHAERRPDVRFLVRMARWIKAEPAWRMSGKLEEYLKAELQKAKHSNSNRDAWAIENFDQPLLRLLREAQAQRSGFDPFNVCDASVGLDDNLGDYFDLIRTAAEASSAPPFTADLHHDLEEARISDSETFVRLLFTKDPERWKDALANEGLVNVRKKLGDDVFGAILEQVKEEPERVSVAWLEMLAPLLTPAQLAELASAGRVFERLLSKTPASDGEVARE